MDDKSFRIGLCMAGAVSAGAYTAGVMDYLLEALEEWERQRGMPGIPAHKVLIPVIGGASAGGMTAVVTASSLNEERQSVPVPSQRDLLKEHPENKFYNTWVDLLGEDMFSKMLETSDIEKGNIISLLNSRFIDEIAHKITRHPAGQLKEIPSFFEKPLKIFTTLSNLEGFDYNIDFNPAEKREKYIMTVHNDYACFGLYENDIQKDKVPPGWMPLNFTDRNNVETAKKAAMATGAFPFGLEPRILNRNGDDVRNIKWLKKYFVNGPEKPQEYKTLNVDGGMINNEPFEKVRSLLDDITQKEFTNTLGAKELNKINIEHSTFVNTVLMIDPFPSKPKKDREPFNYDKSLFSVLGKLFTAVTNQMKVKAEDYMLAMEDTHASQYLITPVRHFKDAEGKTEEVSGDMAIACGTLGGFGGFISKEFRVHDYYLGRFNCEIFLRDYFTVPEKAIEENEIFRKGYEGIDKARFKSAKSNSYQIIPIFTERPAKGYFPMPVFSNGSDWPTIKEGVIDAYRPKIRKRVQKITLNLFELGFVNRFLIFAGSKIVLNRMLTNKLLGAIKKNFKDWGLLINNR